MTPSKTCKGCEDKFNPTKPFHSYCSACSKLLTKCLSCSGLVFPKDETYFCCGIAETVSAVNLANKPSRFRGRSLEEMLFIMEHNMTPEQSAKIWTEDDYDNAEQ